MRLGQPDWLVSAPCGLSSASRLARSCSIVRAGFQGASKSCQASWELGLGLVPVTSSTSYWPQQVTAQPDSGKRNHFLTRRGSKSHHKGPERGVCGTFFFFSILFYCAKFEEEKGNKEDWCHGQVGDFEVWNLGDGSLSTHWGGLMSGSWSF